MTLGMTKRHLPPNLRPVSLQLRGSLKEKYPGSCHLWFSQQLLVHPPFIEDFELRKLGRRKIFDVTHVGPGVSNLYPLSYSNVTCPAFLRVGNVHEFRCSGDRGVGIWADRNRRDISHNQNGCILTVVGVLAGKRV